MTPSAESAARREPRSVESHHVGSDLLYAVVWLVFLVLPVSALLQSAAPVPARVLGLVGLALFAALYTVSWIRQILAPRLSPAGNAALWCFILLLPLTLLAPASPWGAVNTAPFFVALCAFRLPLRQGMVASAVIACVAFLPVLVLLPREDWLWPLLGVAPAWFIILLSRFAVDRSETYERLARELAVSRQREAVGRDVHDILGHSLTVITVKTQLAQRLVKTDPQRAVAELDDVLALSREALTDVRSTVGKLRDLDLGVELVQARAALRAAGINPHLPSSVPPLDAVTRSVFAWILREAVTNVVRHSGASRCWVTVTGTSLRIDDDGAGSPVHSTRGGTVEAVPGTGPRSGAEAGRAGRGTREGAASYAATVCGADGRGIVEGNGIRGMKDRARAAGYEVTVTRAPHGGTTVEVTRA